jgi:putative ABC transport system permease protein
VVDDFPSNSHFQFTALLSVDYGKEKFHPANWLSHDPFTYVLLPEKANSREVEKRIREMTERILEPIYKNRYGKTYREQRQLGGLQEYRLQPLEEVHLYSADMNEGDGIRNVYVLSTIGIILILLACFNYINISTARSVWDAKSAGIRKVLGSTRTQLYNLFLTESVCVALVASVLAIVLAQTVLASDISLLHAFIPYKSLPVEACLLLLALSLAVGLLSGLVPAKLVTAFEPTQVIKGQLSRGKGGNSLRQILVVAQFIVSMGLIMCTFQISSQLTFMQNMSLGLGCIAGIEAYNFSFCSARLRTSSWDFDSI